MHSLDVKQFSRFRVQFLNFIPFPVKTVRKSRDSQSVDGLKPVGSIKLILEYHSYSAKVFFLHLTKAVIKS